MTRRSDGIKFQIGIRRARKHTHTWIILSSSFQLRRSTNADDDDWHTDCVVAVSNLHSFVYKQQKKEENFALPFVLTYEWIEHSRTIIPFLFLFLFSDCYQFTIRCATAGISHHQYYIENTFYHLVMMIELTIK